MAGAPGSGPTLYSWRSSLRWFCTVSMMVCTSLRRSSSAFLSCTSQAAVHHQAIYCVQAHMFSGSRHIPSSLM